MSLCIPVTTISRRFGGNHLIHAARRIDLKVICVNNLIYAMTGGQTAPTTPSHSTQRRLLKVTDREVEFLAKDAKTNRSFPTRYSLQKFVAWLAEHVPDHYRHAIRYFGLLAPRGKQRAWTTMFAILGQPRRRRPQRSSWRNSLIKYFRIDPLIDSRGQTMRWVRHERLMFH